MIRRVLKLPLRSAEVSLLTYSPSLRGEGEWPSTSLPPPRSFMLQILSFASYVDVRRRTSTSTARYPCRAKRAGAGRTWSDPQRQGAAGDAYAAVFYRGTGLDRRQRLADERDAQRGHVLFTLGETGGHRQAAAGHPTRAVNAMTPAKSLAPAR